MITKMPQKPKNPLPQIPELTEPIGKRVARSRMAQGLTQIEVSGKIGISQPLYSSYERGRLGISGEMAVRIALALGVTTDEVLGMAEPETQTLPPKFVKRLKQIKDLPPQQQKIILQSIDLFLRGATVKAS